jgi:hypothetical protein
VLLLRLVGSAGSNEKRLKWKLKCDVITNYAIEPAGDEGAIEVKILCAKN